MCEFYNAISNTALPSLQLLEGEAYNSVSFLQELVQPVDMKNEWIKAPGANLQQTIIECYRYVHDSMVLAKIGKGSSLLFNLIGEARMSGRSSCTLAPACQATGEL